MWIREFVNDAVKGARYSVRKRRGKFVPAGKLLMEQAPTRCWRKECSRIVPKYKVVSLCVRAGERYTREAHPPSELTMRLVLSGSRSVNQRKWKLSLKGVSRRVLPRLTKGGPQDSGGYIRFTMPNPGLQQPRPTAMQSTPMEGIDRASRAGTTWKRPEKF